MSTEPQSEIPNFVLLDEKDSAAEEVKKEEPAAQ